MLSGRRVQSFAAGAAKKSTKKQRSSDVTPQKK